MSDNIYILLMKMLIFYLNYLFIYVVEEELLFHLNFVFACKSDPAYRLQSSTLITRLPKL